MNFLARLWVSIANLLSYFHSYLFCKLLAKCLIPSSKEDVYFIRDTKGEKSRKQAYSRYVLTSQNQTLRDTAERPREGHVKTYS